MFKLTFWKKALHNANKYRFLFEQLILRDFRKKYRRAALGVLWSLLSPLLTLFVMKLVFTQFFGRGDGVVHYTIYLFSGLLVYNFYREATQAGMSSLMENNKIISKINVPKYLFILSENVSAMINFLLTLVVYFVFCAVDGIHFSPRMLMLIHPILWLTLMNFGVSLLLASWFVFFRDMKYLYGVFLRLLNYVCAIFYQVDRFPKRYHNLFLLNPVYVVIKYFRLIVIDEKIPSTQYQVLCAGYAIFFLILGCWTYNHYKNEFIYYL
ncbi:MAG: ABC transporter permease [Butyrivibrio sp.]|nr:ABC transporter permease [Butyrivibrio sp.]